MLDIISEQQDFWTECKNEILLRDIFKFARHISFHAHSYVVTDERKHCLEVR